MDFIYSGIGKFLGWLDGLMGSYVLAFREEAGNKQCGNLDKAPDTLESGCFPLSSMQGQCKSFC